MVAENGGFLVKKSVSRCPKGHGETLVRHSLRHARDTTETRLFVVGDRHFLTGDIL
jgi:hypothetical protein